VTTSPALPIKSETKTFRTPEFVVDALGNMFAKTSIELAVDGRQNIVVLDAEQVELLLKILRIAPYAE
jgi:hypothetical protein